MPHRFAPIAQRTLRHTVLDSIRAAILDGALPAGSQLVEARIAEEMRVSRGPVREALRQLEEEGLVTSLPYRGTFVTQLAPQEITEISSLRMVLERFAIERALPRLQHGDGLARLDAAAQRLADLARQGDSLGCVEAHLAFHRVFYELADHGWLLQVWTSLESRLRLYLRLDHLRFASLDEVAEAHLALLDLARQGHPRQILLTLLDHIQSPAEDLAGRLGRRTATTREDRRPAAAPG